METTTVSSNGPNYKYYDFLMAAFVTILLCTDLIASSKVCEIAGFHFGGGILFFPMSYFFDDVLTEVYGYKGSRRVVWAGFTALVFASVMSWVVVALPASKDWPHQNELKIVFGQTPRIVFASLTAYWAGEFCNAYIMAKVKILTNGKYLWIRTLGSTVVGEAVDSLIFYPVAFYNEWPIPLILSVMISNFCLKVLWEVLMTPAVYLIINFLKKHENLEIYDYDTDFNPFSLEK